MRRFASEFFEQSPVLLYPVLALVLFFIVFLVVVHSRDADEGIRSGSLRAHTARGGVGGTP